MKRFSVALLCITACSFLVASCKKGEEGPAGPAGTANVLYSAWMPTTPWTASTTSTGSGKQTFYFDITAAKITQDILDNGTVLVYAKFVADPDGTGIVKALPSDYYNLGSASTQYRFQYGLSVGKIRVICDVLPAGTPSTSNQIRYVIIPGGTSAGRVAANSPSTVDLTGKTYEEIAAMFHIPANGSNL